MSTNISCNREGCVFVAINLPGDQVIGVHMHPEDYITHDDYTLTDFEGVWDDMLQQVHGTLYYGIRDYLESNDD